MKNSNIPNMINPYLTVDSRVPVGTGALICPITVKTGATVEARLGVALIYVILAVAAGESS